MTTDFTSDVSITSLGQAGAAGASTRNLNFKRLIRMRGPLMIAVAVAVAVPLIVAVWFVIPREYNAAARIRFSNTRPTVLTNAGGSAISSDYVTHVQTQVNIIQGASVLSRVAERQDIRSLPLIAKQADPLRFLEEHVRARLIPTTELVEVSFQSSERDTAIAIVQATVDEYLKFATSAEKARDVSITEQLIAERQILEQRVADLRETVAERREAIAGVQLPGMNSVDSELRAYHDNLSKALADQTTAEKRIEQIEVELGELQALTEQQQQNPQAPIYKFGIEESVNEDGAVRVQTQMLANQEAELARAQSRYVADHPQVRLYQEARDASAGELAEAQATARSKVLQSRFEESRHELQTAEKALEEARTRIANFDAELEKQSAEALEVNKALSGVREIEDELDGAREDLKNVQDRIRVLQVESRAPATIEVAVGAYAPTEPDNGKRLKYMALVLMGSCGVGFGVGLWREISDQQVRTAQDIGYCTDLPLMGIIPDAGVEQLPVNVNMAVVAAEHPDSISADAIRRVITRIIYPPEGSAELNTCLVTSASRGDGKTTTSCNLAIALAQANRRVLLVDLSARRPSVEKRLGMTSAAGLSEIFSSDIRAEDAIRETQYPNLSVLGPGLNSKVLVGKLASRETVEFLEYAEETFEHVIIDTPPVLLMSDAKLLAPIVDGVIVVVGAEVSMLGMVRRTLRDLQQIGSNVVGVVLNRVKHVPGGYMRRNLASYYTYEHENADEPAAGTARPVRPLPVSDAEADGMPTIMLVDDEEGDPPRRDEY
ncbi:MAG: polysaccharide biosynthesis tyrosine autokinase [Candidatus Hydrogenedentes bacterium]|nr:polysaccharide biosynthesis tyrosine autokinase [Candidatus Hydrogenedentota bacterium]